MQINAQSMLTNGAVYDFSIGDEFQSTTTASGSTPNAMRYKIIAKRFSTNNDTVFYRRTYNNYNSSLSYTPSPHLVYTSTVGIDSVFYTKLSTLISAQFSGQPNDSCNAATDTLYHASQFCDTLVYEHYNCSNCCFEGIVTDDIFGKGLGQVSHHYIYNAYSIDTRTYLFYYKKGAVTCGTPDTTLATAAIATFNTQHSIFKIFPNPAQNNFTVEVATNEKQTISVYDVNGKQVLLQTITGTTNIDVGNLNTGVYSINITSNEGVATKKFVIIR